MAEPHLRAIDRYAGGAQNRFSVPILSRSCRWDCTSFVCNGSHRHGRIGAEISDIQASLAAGDLAKLRVVLHALDQEIAAIPDTRPGSPWPARARSALLAIGEAVNRQHEYFESHPA